MGVQEYFAYDPNPKPLARATARRLFGWRRHPQTGLMLPPRFGLQRRLWSLQLESWLVPDGVFLRLYDRHGNLRLTEAEAMAQRAEALAEKLRSLGYDPDQL